MEPRQKKLSVRVSETEQAEVARLAQSASMSVSDYGRKRLLAQPVNQKIVPEINLDTYRTLVDLHHQVRAIGHNLNQLTKWMHTHQSIPPSITATITDTQQQIETTQQILQQIQLASVGANR